MQFADRTTDGSWNFLCPSRNVVAALFLILILILLHLQLWNSLISICCPPVKGETSSVKIAELNAAEFCNDCDSIWQTKRERAWHLRFLYVTIYANTTGPRQICSTFTCDTTTHTNARCRTPVGMYRCRLRVCVVNRTSSLSWIYLCRLLQVSRRLLAMLRSSTCVPNT